jgi:phosphoglucosamine mutase
MAKKYFGTDGIRGRANGEKMNAFVAMRAAMAAAVALREQNGAGGRARVVIGKDTRISGYMIEQAMAAGFSSMGVDVVFLGPLPTPAVAMHTRSMRADLGVMISASHNAYQDNGIKFFGSDGYKLSDQMETRIEELIDADDIEQYYPEPHGIGQASRLDDASGRYIECIKGSFPKGMNLQGMRVIIDCANGAAYKVAPQTLWELEADVIPLAINPNGININRDAGATDTAALQKAVTDYEADLGIALDGDADRLIMVDERGQRIDGDQIMAVIAKAAKDDGKLACGALVATVMSNLGLEHYLKDHGIDLVRTAVGDRYVVEEMRKNGYNIGGEQSGHMVLTDYATTGDGLLASMQMLSVLKMSGLRMSELCNAFTPVPQILQNVKYSPSVKPMELKVVQDAIEQGKEKLSDEGRVLVRASGTEPLIRVMAEGFDEDKVARVVNDICETIQKNA